MSETKQIPGEQAQNGQPSRPDAVEVALDHLHVQKRGEILAAVLRNIEEQRESLRLEQSFGRYGADAPIPGLVRDGQPTTFTGRFREFDAGIKQLKADSSEDAWEIGTRLYNDPSWEPQR